MASATTLPPTLSTLTLDSLPTTDGDNSDSDDFHDAQDQDNRSSASSSSSFSKQPQASVAVSADDKDDDLLPAFPSLNSAQRQSAPKASSASAKGSAAAFLGSLKPSTSTSSLSDAKDSALMPPPPPSLTVGGGGARSCVPGGRAGGGGALMVPPSTSSLFAPPGVGGASGASINKGEKRKKVALASGCSPLDWARLKNSTDLRGGVTQLMRITPSELKKHHTRQDAWSAFYGKVYNITPYLRFHPGGEDDLIRVAGRDGTRLFALTHSWVNIDAMIDTAMVGVLVSE